MNRVYYNSNNSSSRPTTPSTPDNYESDRLFHSSTNSSADSMEKMGISSEINYKTQLCRGFSTKGYCQYNTFCRFAHGEHELRVTPNLNATNPRYKTAQCRNYEQHGYCNYGANCQFIHDDSIKAKEPRAETAEQIDFFMNNILTVSQLYHNFSTSFVDNLVLEPKKRFVTVDIGPQVDPYANLSWNRNVIK